MGVPVAVTSTLVASSGSVLLLVGEVNGWGGWVGVGRRWRQQATWPELSGGYDVDFGGVQGEPRAQIQPEQQAKDDREHPIHLAGVAQVVVDQVATDSLQGLPRHPSDHRTSKQLPGRDLLGVSTPNASRNSPTLTAAAAARLAMATATALPP